MSEPLRERRAKNQAVRVAYGWARRGEPEMARLWLRLAGQFAAVTPKQEAHVERLVAEARGATIIPGQLDLEGREAA